MKDLLTIAVIIGGSFTVLLVAWLIHVAKREDHLFKLSWIIHGPREDYNQTWRDYDGGAC